MTYSPDNRKPLISFDGLPDEYWNYLCSQPYCSLTSHERAVYNFERGRRERRAYLKEVKK